MKHYILKAFAILSILFFTEAQAQDGNVTVNQNNKIDALLELKKEASL